MKFKSIILTCFAFATILVSCEAQGNKDNSQKNEKKTKSMNLTSSDTTQQLMNEGDFWKLIDQSRVASKYDYQTQINALKIILLTLEPRDIEKFDNTFTALLAATYDYKLWGASYVINGGCSDDCFDYFRHYLIGQGKERFYETVNDPESCVNWIKSEEEDNWEGLQYAAMDAYKQKTGKEIPKTYQPKFELKGKPFDDETVMKQYPKLAKKFMGNTESGE
ncbi:MAG: DUF4240 domain-containing protein [Chitinophagaceae bacterium]|nr:DUF4240 domain-containing protein [Chitinophagaceae bacterium]